jgi:hypothetical protein
MTKIAELLPKKPRITPYREWDGEYDNDMAISQLARVVNELVDAVNELFAWKGATDD